jgi:formate hydrogenlyase subunit 6/NADH:ubiquinone oxidoreductase subunit I/predicted flap endonuclease-1-like 5' DNA nuclease
VDHLPPALTERSSLWEERVSLLKDIWGAVSGIGKGMEKTYDEQFDPVFTEMYPFVQPQLPPVSVQSLALIKNEDGTDRCVSCLACEKVCPSQVITIERKRNPAGKGFVLERFDIDLVNCMYCAACVESCPAQAIVTIQDFEMSTPNLQTLKADKDFLDFQGLRASQWYSPKVGVEYREEDPENPIHGKIVKAPIEEQPGGLQEMEKARLAALTPSAPGTTGTTEPPKPVVEKPAAEAPKAEAAAPAPTPAAPVVEPPKAVVSSPAPEAPKAEAAPVEAPTTPAPVAEAPKAEALISSPVPEAPKTEVAPAPSSETATPAASSTANTVPDAKQETPSQTVSSSTPDDLTVIEGIGPKRAAALVRAGITTFAQLAQTEKAKLEEIMTGADISLEQGIETWPMQADLLAKGDTAGFNALTVRLVAGRVTNDKPKKKKSGDA